MRSRKGLLCDLASLRLCVDFSKIVEERSVLEGSEKLDIDKGRSSSIVWLN